MILQAFSGCEAMVPACLRGEIPAFAAAKSVFRPDADRPPPLPSGFSFDFAAPYSRLGTAAGSFSRRIRSRASGSAGSRSLMAASTQREAIASWGEAAYGRV